MSDLTTYDLLMSPLDLLKSHFVKLEIAKVTLESAEEEELGRNEITVMPTVYLINRIEMAMEEFDKAYKELVEAYKKRPMKMYTKTLDDLTKLPDVEQVSVQVEDEQITWTDESNAPIIDFMLRLNALHKKD